MTTQNIPGTSFHIKDDGRLIPVVNGPITDTVLIIGCAVDGPVNVPVQVNAKNVEQVFGPVVYDTIYTSDKVVNGNDPLYGRYNGNSLVKAYSEVVQGGCTNIILMRIGDPDGTITKQADCVIAETPTDETKGPWTKASSQTGDSASTLLGIDLKGKYAGSVYNGIGIKLTYTVASSAVTAAKLEIHQEFKRKGRQITIPLNTGAGITITKRQLIEKINGDLRNLSVVASSLDGDTDLDSAVPLKPLQSNGEKIAYFVLDGGTDGTRANSGTGKFTTAKSVYEALMGGTGLSDPAEDSPFAKIETVETDIVYMAALYADENIGTESNPASIMVPFAKALHTAAKNDYPMIGVVGAKPATDQIPPRVSTIVDNLTAEYDPGDTSKAIVPGNTSMLKLGYFVSQDPDTKSTVFDYLDPDLNTTVDLGRYILCVAGPDVVISNPKLGQYIETAAGVYAGLISTLPPYRAVTNMAVPGIKQLSYAFTNRQLNKLAGGQPYDEVLNESGTGGSYILFRKNTSGQIVVNLDNTCAARESDYASYQVVYIVNMVASGLKQVCEPFIGMGAHETTKNALENEITKFLDYVAETKAIAGGKGVGYDFDISADGVDQLLGRINIDLTLRPALQIKAINVVISVAPPLGG